MNRLGLVLAIGLNALCLSAHAEDTTGEWVDWQFYSEDSARDFARSLAYAAEASADISATESIDPTDIVAAHCEARVWRTKRDHPVRSHEENILACSIETDSGEEGLIEVDIRDETILRWGNVFFPKGFMMKGEIAASIYAGMDQVYNKLPSSFDFDDVTIARRGVSYGYTALQLLRRPDAPHTGLECSREFFFHGTTRPEQEDHTRCVFVYQYKR